MELLPKSFSEFSTEAYWNSFFHKRGLSFEWYGEYEELKEYLHKYIKKTDALLTVGCGNSDVSYKLYLNGVTSNMNIDISDLVIYQMNTKYKKDNETIHFVKMDVFNMEFKDGTFNVVLDKGTLDTIAAENSEETMRKVDRMFTEIDRVLKLCGRYLCFSLMQPYILEELLHWFKTKQNYMIRIHRCFAAETSFPVFLIVCTKLNKPADHPIELALNIDQTAMVKTTETSEVLESIRDIQKYSLFRNHVRNDEIPENSEVCFHLFVPTDSVNPRYSFYIQDQPTNEVNTNFSIFIVPEGRETEWLFGSLPGRKALLGMANTKRLIVVHLNRNHKYTDLETVKKELSQKVMDFAHDGVKPEDVPFLSVGEDLGKRLVKCRGTSAVSGKFVIEDVHTPEKEVYRRLIFMANSDVIQSEVKLKKEPKQNYEIDHSYLSCQHHYAIVTGLAFAKRLSPASNTSMKVLLVGLGGGCLATYIQRCIKLNFKLDLEVVEIDPEILKVAKAWFDFKPESTGDSNVSIQVVIDDGLKYLEKRLESKDKYHVVIFDVDSKDLKNGISCPPESFVESTILENVHSLLVENDGLFILNLVARNTKLKDDIRKRISLLFPTLFSYKIPDDLNEVLYCFATSKGDEVCKDWEMSADSWIQEVLTEKSLYDDFPELNGALELLKL